MDLRELTYGPSGVRSAQIVWSGTVVPRRASGDGRMHFRRCGGAGWVQPKSPHRRASKHAAVEECDRTRNQALDPASLLQIRCS